MSSPILDTIMEHYAKTSVGNRSPLVNSQDVTANRGSNGISTATDIADYHLSSSANPTSSAHTLASSHVTAASNLVSTSIHSTQLNSKGNSNSNKTILVSGINGYIASHIGLLLLQKGYRVRGASRSIAARESLLSEAFASYADQYEHVEVPDVTTPGAWDEAVRGVHGIIHTASPVNFKLTSLDDFLVPAVQGVLEILNSARAHAGPQLESFVLTSSIAAIADRWKHPGKYHYSETDWNTSSEGVARASFIAPVAYGASKVAAERGMWEWARQESAQSLAAGSPLSSFLATLPSSVSTSSSPPPSSSTSIPLATTARKTSGSFSSTTSTSTTVSTTPLFSISAINPGVVTGPPVHLPSHPSKLNETLAPVWKILAGECADDNSQIPPQIGGATYIDVRDVAALHVYCVEHPSESNGQRYLAANGKAPPQAAADLLRARYPRREIVLGVPGQGYTDNWDYPDDESSFDNSKARKALGGVDRLRPFSESIYDTVDVFERRWGDLIRNRKK